jgi:hypothetical protein
MQALHKKGRGTTGWYLDNLRFLELIKDLNTRDSTTLNASQEV